MLCELLEKPVMDFEEKNSNELKNLYKILKENGLDEELSYSEFVLEIFLEI